MAQEDSVIVKEESKEASIVEGWARISSEYKFGKLSEQEKAQFERAQFAEEQAKKKSFVLGMPLHCSF
jgi:hypothetical protein